MRICHAAMVFPLLACAFAVPHAARAAEGYDNCTGFIDTVPATISTQGTWCLRHDLSTGITNGQAIEIAANNVTIDCNDFKLGGMAAGSVSNAIGIHALDRQNAVVRHCSIRGFLYGIYLSDDGALVEDNRFDNNLAHGIVAVGEHNLIQRNRIYDTGGWASGVESVGIDASADIIDNVVDGVSTAGTTSHVMGVVARADGMRIIGNRIGGLRLNGGAGEADGILIPLSRNLTIERNHIVAEVPGTNGMGVSSNSGNRCVDNTIANFSHGRVVDICNIGNDEL